MDDSLGLFTRVMHSLEKYHDPRTRNNVWTVYELEPLIRTVEHLSMLLEQVLERTNELTERVRVLEGKQPQGDE